MICRACVHLVVCETSRMCCPHCASDQFDMVGRTTRELWTHDDVRPVLEREAVRGG
jgi:hypothetical protein